MNNDAILEMT